jgi:hypothetical protein
MILAPSLARLGTFFIPSTHAGIASADGTIGPVVFVANQPLKAYVPSGAQVFMVAHRLGVSSGAPGNWECTVSGYFVNQ